MLFLIHRIYKIVVHQMGTWLLVFALVLPSSAQLVVAQSNQPPHTSGVQTPPFLKLPPLSLQHRPLARDLYRRR